MTGGRAVVLGAVGRNFAAGMSGGIAYLARPRRDGRGAMQHRVGRARAPRRGRRRVAPRDDRAVRARDRLAGRRGAARAMARGARRVRRGGPARLARRGRGRARRAGRGACVARRASSSTAASCPGAPSRRRAAPRRRRRLRAGRPRAARRPGDAVHGLRGGVLPRRVPARQPDPRVERPRRRRPARATRSSGSTRRTTSPSSPARSAPRPARPRACSASATSPWPSSASSSSSPAGLRRGPRRRGPPERRDRSTRRGGGLGSRGPRRGPAAAPRRATAWWCSSAPSGPAGCFATASRRSSSTRPCWIAASSSSRPRGSASSAAPPWARRAATAARGSTVPRSRTRLEAARAPRRVRRGRARDGLDRAAGPRGARPRTRRRASSPSSCSAARSSRAEGGSRRRGSPRAAATSSSSVAATPARTASGPSLRQGAASVTQLEILPRPPDERPASAPWPTYPALFRVSSSQEEGATRRFGGAHGRADRPRRRHRGPPRPRRRRRARPSGSRADLVVLAMGFTGAERGVLERPRRRAHRARHRRRSTTGSRPRHPGCSPAGTPRAARAWWCGRSPRAARRPPRSTQHLMGRTSLPAPVRPTTEPLRLSAPGRPSAAVRFAQRVRSAGREGVTVAMQVVAHDVALARSRPGARWPAVAAAGALAAAARAHCGPRRLRPDERRGGLARRPPTRPATPWRSTSLEHVATVPRVRPGPRGPTASWGSARSASGGFRRDVVARLGGTLFTSPRAWTLALGGGWACLHLVPRPPASHRSTGHEGRLRERAHRGHARR